MINGYELPNLKISSHPLIQDKLTRLRDKYTPHYEFRELMEAISMILFWEASSFLSTEPMRVATPLETTMVERLKNPIALIPILRAGMAMVNGILKTYPRAYVGMVGMYRDEDTLMPVDYYLRLPQDLQTMDTFLLDPMLATGGSAKLALDTIKEKQPHSLTMITIISAPEGVSHLQKYHPDVQIYSGALDRELNHKGFILPGLGDAGDRYFGT